MHKVHTIAAPPNHGRIGFARTGWTRNSRNALRKIVAACSGIEGTLKGARILARGSVDTLRAMLARLAWVAQLVEASIYVAAGAWLHHRWGMRVPALLAFAAAWALGWRLAFVTSSLVLGWIFASPRGARDRIGIAGTPGLVFGAWLAFLALSVRDM